ncbi:histone-arginine methyltransferase CARM1 isoform X2 [Antennarius striatus]|uniref:histone-arginine methyltransferase CARM1 isoform X2 n=1 Tax=Antennarius striatus TaxID=241820 RepID=UPI0035AD9D5C
MEERSEESPVFPVRVFRLQEEENVETREEEVRVCRQAADQELSLLLRTERGEQQLVVCNAHRASVFQFTVSKEMDFCQVGGQSFLVAVGNTSLLLQFRTPADMRRFQQRLRRRDEDTDAERDPTSSWQRPGCEVSCLSQQQTLLQDILRITTYQRAFLANEVDFRDKAGARRVYAVESSPMSRYTQILVQSNNLSEQIRVLEGEVEEVSCPDLVDVIVSEPMGYLLLNDRLMGSFLHARKWLKPNGHMFPSRGDIHLAPFSDEQLYFEHYARASFWQQRSFYGVNLSSLHSPAVDEFYKQPIVDTFDVQILMARSVKHCIDFMEATEADLLRMEIPFVFTLLQSGLIHGLAFWFDVAYSGSKSTVWLSTAPTEPLTRWYQVRCLLQTPLFAKLGQTLSGTVLLVANNRKSYDIHITATVDQSGFRSGNVLDLKNPFFRLNFIPL